MRRNRHGRGLRGPLAWPPVPAMGTRRTDFDDVVTVWAERAARFLGPRYAAVEFAVEEVPPTDPAPWEEQVSALGRTVTTERDSRRIVVYRRPIEARVGSPEELDALVREVLVHQLAELLGVPPEEVEL